MAIILAHEDSSHTDTFDGISYGIFTPFCNVYVVIGYGTNRPKRRPSTNDLFFFSDSGLLGWLERVVYLNA